MTAYIFKKMIYGFAVLWGVVTLIFLLFNIMPGDPAQMMLGQRADKQAVDAIREELGLNKSLGRQYVDYLNDLSPISFYQIDADSPQNRLKKYEPFSNLIKVGNVHLILKKPYLRVSYQSKKNVSEVLKESFPNTLILAFVSISFALIVGLLLGISAAVINSNFWNKFILCITTIGMSLPSFFAAILIAWIFGFLLNTGLEMTGSLFSVDEYGRGAYLDLKNLILPALTLGIRPLAVVTELTRTSLLEALSMDYVRTAKAKGLNKYRIIAVHALRNALTPVVTAVSGWFASLMAGAVFVEYIFDWKGIGVVIVDALDKYDFPVIMGAVLLIAFMLIIINIIVDILYGILDPRVRLT